MSKLFLHALGLSIALVASSMAALPNNITFRNVFSGGPTFVRPVFFSEVPGKDSNYVVLEHAAGLASVTHRRNGAWVKDTLLKISVVSNDNVLGLLGLAFHPDFVNNKKYYIFYSQTATTNVIEERQVDASFIKDAGVAPKKLLTLTHTASGNNGGDMAFGPKDGYLYIGVGDGGDPQGDAPNRGQNPDTLLGKFLRIDVNSQTGTKPYGIPATNPFVSKTGYRPEIWALGLRSPWRWSFDGLTGNLWVGEVGNATWEEVDTVPVAGGANLGWRPMEGFGCQAGVTCNPADYTLPLYVYGHVGGENAIIGGYVYRGDPTSPFYGAYFFGDNGSGKVKAIKVTGGKAQDSLVFSKTVAGLSAFGQDSHGNLYAVSVNSGVISVIESPDMKPSATALAYHRAKAGVTSSTDGLEWRDLRGERVKSEQKGRGVYLIRSKDGTRDLVPVIK